MKDSVLTVRRKKIELWTMLACFLIANAIHVYAILTYGADFSEMFTSFFYVLLFAIVLYAVWTVIRLLVYGLMGLFFRQRMKQR